MIDSPSIRAEAPGAWTTPTRLDRSVRAQWTSASLAALVIGGWVGGIVLGMTRGHTLPLPAAAALVLGLTWLSTGVFILAHDAMHGVLLPGSRRWNDRLGATLLALYAFFPWKRMVREHRRHHVRPASDEDPDFHAPGRPGVLAWYARFVRGYVAWPTFVGYALAYNALAHLAGVPERSLILFWIVPVVASTFQLFFFGTWLPHRPTPAGYADHHRAHSTRLPPWLSLLTCFHFGYHWEHHAWPHVPWWRLPSAHAERVARDAPSPLRPGVSP